MCSHPWTCSNLVSPMQSFNTLSTPEKRNHLLLEAGDYWTGVLWALWKGERLWCQFLVMRYIVGAQRRTVWSDRHFWTPHVYKLQLILCGVEFQHRFDSNNNIMSRLATLLLLAIACGELLVLYVLDAIRTDLFAVYIMRGLIYMHRTWQRVRLSSFQKPHVQQNYHQSLHGWHANQIHRT